MLRDYSYIINFTRSLLKIILFQEFRTGFVNISRSEGAFAGAAGVVWCSFNEVLVLSVED